MRRFYILRFDRDAYNALNGRVEEGEEVADDEAVEETFEVVAEVSEQVSLKSFLPLTIYCQTQCQNDQMRY